MKPAPSNAKFQTVHPDPNDLPGYHRHVAVEREVGASEDPALFARPGISRVSPLPKPRLPRRGSTQNVAIFLAI